MNVAGSLALGNNVVINLAPGYSFTSIATGSITVGTSGSVNANLQAGGSNLDATAAGNQCTATGTPGLPASPAAMPWLKFGWTSATPSNPAASVVFGSFKSPLIYRQENY